MQFIVTAYDYKEDGLRNRLAVRGEHIKLGDKLKSEGKCLYGVALLDNKEQMEGSVYIMDFSNREELDEWLKNEPYVLGKVWEKIEVKPCKVGPSFTK
jgi:uncharacterized protein YciI